MLYDKHSNLFYYTLDDKHSYFTLTSTTITLAYFVKQSTLYYKY
jgi:hypothetical protein